MRKKSNTLTGRTKAAVQPEEEQKKIANLQSKAENLAASASVVAIEPKEEASQPGFFAKLWARIIGFFRGIFQSKMPENKAPATPEETQAEEKEIKTLRREAESIRDLSAGRPDVGPGLIQETPPTLAKKPLSFLQKLFGTSRSKAKSPSATAEINVNEAASNLNKLKGVAANNVIQAAKNLNELRRVDDKSAQVENNASSFFEQAKAFRQQQERQQSSVPLKKTEPKNKNEEDNKAKGQGWQVLTLLKQISICFASTSAVNGRTSEIPADPKVIKK